MTLFSPTLHEDEQTLEQIASAIKGDQAAYHALYERFATGLYRLCFSLVLDEADAEDVMQESFVYAFRNLKKYDPRKAAFKTWLYTIAVSRCRNVYRRRSLLLVGLTQALFDVPAPASEAPEACAARKAATEAIAEALGRLSPQLREAVVLRYGHGLAYREIAEVMGCPPKTAESRVRVAQEQLRHLLRNHGPSLLDELLRLA
jgi:RNA polymerase sigma-70 factor (ECF subfamily)